jgi:hypothetical protein
VGSNPTPSAPPSLLFVENWILASMGTFIHLRSILEDENRAGGPVFLDPPALLLFPLIRLSESGRFGDFRTSQKQNQERQHIRQHEHKLIGYGEPERLQMKL